MWCYIRCHFALCKPACHPVKVISDWLNSQKSTDRWQHKISTRNILWLMQTMMNVCTRGLIFKAQCSTKVVGISFTHSACNTVYFVRVAAVHTESEMKSMWFGMQYLSPLMRWSLSPLRPSLLHLHSFTNCDLTVQTSLVTLTVHLNVLHPSCHA